MRPGRGAGRRFGGNDSLGRYLGFCHAPPAVGKPGQSRKARATLKGSSVKTGKWRCYRVSSLVNESEANFQVSPRCTFPADPSAPTAWPVALRASVARNL